MPKHVRRVTFTRTHTYTVTIDVPNKPEETDPNLLTLAGGATGATGQLSIGELLASGIANNGVSTKGSWSVTGTTSNVESYAQRVASFAYQLGNRVASITPVSGNEAARGKLFVCTVAGTSGAGATEPTWALTDGSTTTDGTATFRTIPKFYTPTNYAISTVYAVGTILRPAATSMKEYLVTVQNTSAATTPTWTSNDTVGASVSFQTGGTAICISGCTTYAFDTAYGLGAVVKPSAGSSEEYLCTAAGISDQTALSASVSASVTRGTATFKRII